MQANKRTFTVKQFYNITIDALSDMKIMMNAEKSGLISGKLKEQIMLAVTEVNGCALCLYYHTRAALEKGISEKDIHQMLSGNINYLDEDEVIAVVFAQHYAETMGNYTEKSYNRVVETYGVDKSKAILAVIKGIMLGNAYGIAYGSLGQRLKGKPVKSSKFIDEIGILFSVLVFIPIGLVKNLLTKS